MFYDTFLQLCNEKGVAPSRVALDLGYSKTTASKWKAGSMPSADKLQNIADYFNVSADYLLGNEKTSTAKSAEDETLEELLNRLKHREEMKMLFKLADGATKEDVLRAVAIIEALNSN